MRMTRHDAILKALLARGEQVVPSRSTKWTVVTRSYYGRRVPNVPNGTLRPVTKKSYWYLSRGTGSVRVGYDDPVIHDSMAARPEVVDALVSEGRLG